MRIQRLFAYASAVCLISLLPASAMADVGREISTHSCKESISSVQPSPVPRGRLLNHWVRSDVLHTFAGVITYDGRGHATVTDQGVVIGTGSPDDLTRRANIVMRWPATEASAKRVAAQVR
jgi:hypothetical protein